MQKHYERSLMKPVSWKTQATYQLNVKIINCCIHRHHQC